MPVDVRDMKRRIALELFEAEPVFKVIIDVRVPGVLLPEHWMEVQPPSCVLDVGDGLARPIKDLAIDAEGISGTLAFATGPFFCRAPWDAVAALAVEGVVGIGWQPLGEPQVITGPPVVVTPKEARSRFKVIEGGGG